MPGIEHGLIAAEAAAMFADQPAVLAQFNPFGIGGSAIGDDGIPI